ncbi:hypothetical protein GFY24_25055 [Nocardia sp. SYP-A9097]|uniref:hypothetical protein n=1 Tax=Nocardia sp. SYP-A9097 TaxID=2663237 RepID=UPI00129B4A4F|nr:hypothetical protein [Nocardia sp. SYP-A9097]MRH90670.1 hypothetical protein [Nocardia sp. SYP-A9097]
MLAGWGNRALSVAAAHADLIAFTGAGTDANGKLTLADSAATVERIDHVRALLGERTVEFNLLVQAVVAPEERSAATDYLADNLPPDFSGDLEDLPVVLFGTPDQIADTLRERRKTFGFNYITVLEHNMEKLAPVIALLRGE